MRCPGGLTGKSVGVEGIAGSQADVLLRITLRDGRRIRHVLKAETPSFRIDADSSRAGVVKDYAALGVRHILLGWDHLLFVLALVLLIGWGRSLAWTITSFTAGHSVTLALASLGVVHVPQAPIEAAIALSIYFLAVELTSVRKGAPTLTQRAPGRSPPASACCTALALPEPWPKSACPRRRSRWRSSPSTSGSSWASSPSSAPCSSSPRGSAGYPSPGRNGRRPQCPTGSARWPLSGFCRKPSR